MQQATESVPAARSFDFRVFSAYAAIYILWGSTFLAIRYAVESIPPFMQSGVRALVAGGILMAWAWARGERRFRLADWRSAAVGGFFFFVVCHGLLSWGELRVPSGVASVVLALIPIWVVLLDWLRPGGTRPAGTTLFGVGLGFAGLVMLVGRGAFAGVGGLDVVATIALALSALGWAVGTIYSRYRPLPYSAVATSALQMLAGGALLMLISAATGEWRAITPEILDARAWLAVLYLAVVGSVITFSAYIWLINVSSPSRVSTYAYVNPVVAVFLGWMLAGEQLTPSTMVAAGVIVAAVVVIITSQNQAAKAR